MTRPTLYRDPVGWFWMVVTVGLVVWLLTLIPVVGQAIAGGFVVLLFVAWVCGLFRRELGRGRRR